MSFAGVVLEDPRTGLRIRVLAADEEHGRSFELEYTAPPGSPRRLIPAHRHASWTEHFEVLCGQARYRVGRTDGVLAAGESVTYPPGVAHLHPWNVGRSNLRVRQTTTLHRPDPAAVRETIESFAMLFWLAREGRVDARGVPPPLQAAVIQEVLQRHGGTLAGVPLPVQRPFVRAAAALGRRRGYVAFDPAALRRAA